MEVVLGVVLFSKTSIFALDALLRRKDSTQTVPDVVPAPAPAPAPPSTENEAKIQELEEKLAKLKADARAANSPDTFVQYARLKRAANAVEEELSTLKVEEAPSLPMVDMLASVMPTQNLSRTLRLRVMRSVLGILPLLLLWAYFRFYSDDHGQAVLLADCDVFRPFSSFFSTVSKGCEGADNTCTAVKACAVSYRTVAFVANLVVGRIFAALSGPSTPFL